MYIKFISTRCRPVQTRMQTGHCPDFATLQQCHRLCATFSANIKKFNVMKEDVIYSKKGKFMLSAWDFMFHTAGGMIY